MIHFDKSVVREIKIDGRDYTAKITEAMLVRNIGESKDALGIPR